MMLNEAGGGGKLRTAAGRSSNGTRKHNRAMFAKKFLLLKLNAGRRK
jgi:hypothetical protein